MNNLIFLFTSFLLTGCASWFGQPETEALVAEKPKTTVSRAVRSEPGSLWREDSRWNDLYSTAPSRIVGDTVIVLVGDRLKLRIAPPVVKGSKETNTAQKEDSSKKSEMRSSEGSQEDTKTVEATIREVMPRNLFTIHTYATIRVAGKEGKYSVSGQIRERDIASDDSISSDAILNLKVEPDSSFLVPQEKNSNVDEGAETKESKEAEMQS